MERQTDIYAFEASFVYIFSGQPGLRSEALSQSN